MEEIASLFSGFSDFIYHILPLSPFKQYIELFASFPYLGYLNWFFPIGQAVAVMATWLAVVTSYFVYQWILRHIKVVA